MTPPRWDPHARADRAVRLWWDRTLLEIVTNGSPGTDDASLTVLAGALDVSMCPAATPTLAPITRTSGNWVVRDR